ncbi:Smr/MutS family protein [Bartonella sp. F02]|uniref:Smr/MutS family protein n=1 Tax=Bartonella sp. F02 TaxID=2967262 RepID=UPI0022A959BC|nr:Smr/MutS family protein [Bartonella sp. F02]MCZ2328020.1 Smr/MutS family protein [Bartonella sp. F02]
MQRDRHPLPQDHVLWDKVCQTVIPLHDNSRVHIQKDIIYKKSRVIKNFSFLQEEQQRLKTIQKQKKMLQQTDKIRSFDRTIHRKITKGHYPIEARIDLHGFVQKEAYSALKQFLQLSQQCRLHYVLVITGKGQSYGSDGILCRLVPYWFSTPIFRNYIHAFEIASHKHGGKGALYVKLRH